VRFVVAGMIWLERHVVQEAEEQYDVGVFAMIVATGSLRMR